MLNQMSANMRLIARRQLIKPARVLIPGHDPAVKLFNIGGHKQRRLDHNAVNPVQYFRPSVRFFQCV